MQCGLRGRCFTLIPFRHPIDVIVGAPIAVGPAVATPTEAHVDEVHSIYCDAVKKLYYANRAVHGYNDVELMIV